MIVRIGSSVCLLSLALAFLCSCKKESTTAPAEPPHSPIYFDSFESSADTVGWRGYGEHRLYADAPTGGGRQSLFVSGGCIIPHACINFRNQSSSAYVKLSCWGKRLVGGGRASLRAMNNSCRSISCDITDSVWTHYESTDSLFCARNDTLHLELMSGGIVPSSMLIDMLEVATVK